MYTEIIQEYYEKEHFTEINEWLVSVFSVLPPLSCGNIWWHLRKSKLGNFLPPNYNLMICPSFFNISLISFSHIISSCPDQSNDFNISLISFLHIIFSCPDQSNDKDTELQTKTKTNHLENTPKGQFKRVKLTLRHLISLGHLF